MFRLSRFALVALAFLAAPVAAQEPSHPFSACLGCWEEIPRDNLIRGSRVCVLPTNSANVVDVVTVAGDSIMARQRLDARAPQRAVQQEDCSGTERVTANGVRVYLRTTLTCGGTGRLVNSVMALSPSGEWVDVRGVAFGSNAGVRATRYRELYLTPDLPREVLAALRNRPEGASSARLAATGRITTHDVVEASRYLEVGVLQTLLAELRQGFLLDAQQLVALEAAGVKPSVIDVMVALSYPEVFALDRTRLGDPPPVLAEERIVYGGQMYNPYGYDPYGYGYGRGSGWYNGGRPIVVVERPSGEAGDQEHGKVEKGRGYVGPRGQDRSGTERSGDTRRTGSGSSGGSGSDGSTGRKAKPKGGSGN